MEISFVATIQPASRKFMLNTWQSFKRYGRLMAWKHPAPRKQTFPSARSWRSIMSSVCLRVSALHLLFTRWLRHFRSRPGNIQSQGANSKRVISSDRSLPHGGVGGGTFKPRKLSVASARKAVPRNAEAYTSHGPIQFGIILPGRWTDKQYSELLGQGVQAYWNRRWYVPVCRKGWPWG